MRPQWYALISRAVEEGVSYGLSRAFKHTDAPTRDHLECCVSQGVMDAICEVVDFTEETRGVVVQVEEEPDDLTELPPLRN